MLYLLVIICSHRWSSLGRRTHSLARVAPPIGPRAGDAGGTSERSDVIARLARRFVVDATS